MDEGLFFRTYSAQPTKFSAYPSSTTVDTDKGPKLWEPSAPNNRVESPYQTSGHLEWPRVLISQPDLSQALSMSLSKLSAGMKLTRCRDTLLMQLHGAFGLQPGHHYPSPEPQQSRRPEDFPRISRVPPLVWSISLSSHWVSSKCNCSSPSTLL